MLYHNNIIDISAHLKMLAIISLQTQAWEKGLVYMYTEVWLSTKKNMFTLSLLLSIIESATFKCSYTGDKTNSE